MPDPYLILKRGATRNDADDTGPHTIWAEIGAVEGEYRQAAARKAAEEHGAGEYMVIGTYGAAQRFSATARTEFDVEPIDDAQPSLAEIVERAA